MKLTLRIIPVFLLLFTVILSGCSDSGTNDTSSTETQVVADIPGNISTLITNRAPVEDVNDHPDESGSYTFYDFQTGETVSDSASAEWDIAFSSTTILANSGNGGGILVANSSYGNLEEAPSSGYAAQTEGQSWYTYTGFAPSGPQHAILPDTSKTIVVLTPAGKYAKVQILSYYKGNPDTSTEEFANTETRPASGYFTFNYSLQNEAGNNALNNAERFTYYDLEEGEVVEDKTSPQWDLAFSETTIYANAENEGGVQLLNIPLENVDEAPVSGYEPSNANWYVYIREAASGPQHVVLVKEEATLMVKTPDNNYAKVRMLSYYKGNPDITSEEFINTETRSESRYFTFEYIIQADGTTFFN